MCFEVRVRLLLLARRPARRRAQDMCLGRHATFPFPTAGGGSPGGEGGAHEHAHTDTPS